MTSKLFAVIVGISTISALPSTVSPVSFGSQSDVHLATKLWNEMAAKSLVGPDRIKVRPFAGNEPHGAIQQVTGTRLQIDGRMGRVLVKANHLGPGASIESVYDAPNKYLGAYTVMFKMKKGYDPENKDWFWAKFSKIGEILRHPKGIKLAGRIAKESEDGCIFCHSTTGGNDLEVLTER